MDRDKHKGAITIYLSIVLSAVILLCGVLMDVVRIKVAEIQVRRAANTAAVSALAGYGTKLKQDYGLFALHNSNKAFLKEEVEYYLRSQLVNDVLSLDKNKHAVSYPMSLYLDGGIKKVSFINLFDYRIESLSVTPIYNLTENEVVKRQIIEYMKYRAPVQFAEHFIDKVKQAANTEKLALGYKQKTIIEKKLGNIENAIKRLQKNIDTINEFHREDFSVNSEADSALIRLCKSITLHEIYNACKAVDIEELQNKDDYSTDIGDNINQEYEEAAQQLTRIKGSLEHGLSSCIMAVERSLQEINEIKVHTAQIQLDIEHLRKYMRTASSDNTDKALEDKALSAMEKDIEGYSRLLQNNNTQGVLKDLERNNEILEHLKTSLLELDNIIAHASREITASAVRNLRNSIVENSDFDVVNQVEFDLLIDELKSNSRLIAMERAAANYLEISSVMEASKAPKGIDPRKEAAVTIKKVIDKSKNSSADSKIIEKPELLPSYSYNGTSPNKIFSEGQMGKTESDYYIPRVVEDFDADFMEDSSFVQEGFDYILGFADMLKSKSLDMRDEIYVNEYILKTFKDAVEVADSNTDGKYNTTLFDTSEVEYILGGKAQEGVNKLLVKGQILLIRMGMNTLHVYGDSHKRLKSLEAATAVSGFTGFGIPIVHNLIMCAWGAAEAYYDIQDLYNGQKVPFIKTSESWRTDLLASGFGPKNNSSREAGLMDFDYHDYLRLLLLVEDGHTKVNRVQDLIQLNLQQSDPGFKLNGCNTYVKVEAQVSIKYWFITKLFVPLKNKTQDGNRHIIKVEAWRGY